MGVEPKATCQLLTDSAETMPKPANARFTRTKLLIFSHIFVYININQQTHRLSRHIMRHLSRYMPAKPMC
jgi:hypothetical protein